MASPLAKGLFQRAIGQSGGCFAPMQYLRVARHGAPSAEEVGEGLAKIMGCDQAADPLAAMRAKSAEELVAAAAKDPAQARPRAIVDGWVFPQEIATIYADGQQSLIPVLVGSNADEGTSLVGPMAPTSMDGFLGATRKKFGDLTERFLKVYPATSDSDVRDAFLHSFRDERFTWEMRSWARMMQKAGAKTYLYYFSHVPPRPDAAKLGAYHAAEIPYVFNNLSKTPWGNSPSEQALAEEMSGCWVRFAASGDPNGGGLPTWNAYDAQKEPYLEFGNATIGTGTALLKAECDFFDAYAAANHAEN